MERHWADPGHAFERIQVVSKFRGSPEFKAMARLFKRIKNITKDASGQPGRSLNELRAKLKEEAEFALADEVATKGPRIHDALLEGRFVDVMNDIVGLRPVVDRFFDDVMVMTDDVPLREARLAYLVRLRNQIEEFADPSAIVQDDQ